MKNLTNFIQEKYLIDNDIQTYTCQPKDKYELREILEKRLKENKNANLNDIDVSQITDMGYKDLPDNKGLFEDLDPHNIDISGWDVSKVIDMSAMFYKCGNFNCDLSKWNVSNVENMSFLFDFCCKLDCDLNNWDVSNVKKMINIFYGCVSLNKPKWY